MKYYLTLFLLCFVSFALLSQAASSKTQTSSVSKYSYKYDKNTKEKLNKKSIESIDNQSFNYFYTQYLNSDETNKDYAALLAAYSLKPTYTELYFEMVKYYELSNSDFNKKELCKKMQNSTLTPALREYAYNTLMSVEQNGILVTYGEDDTYPIWILQSLENIRTDVKVLNYNLLMNKTYRAKVQSEHGLKFAKKYSQTIAVLKDVAIKNKNKPVYFSLTVSHLVLKELKNNLFATGLALKYSTSAISNSELIKTNWETKFSKIYLNSVTISTKEKQLNLNYALPLLQLSRYYNENNMELEKKAIHTIIKQIATGAGKSKEIETLLAKQK